MSTSVERAASRGPKLAGAKTFNARPDHMWTNNEISLELGRRLASRRHELGLSLAQVAERCGVSLQQIHKYETGQNIMSAPMLFQLALCLDVPASYFFEPLEQRRVTQLTP